jgi:hypothetical protein
MGMGDVLVMLGRGYVKIYETGRDGDQASRSRGVLRDKLICENDDGLVRALGPRLADGK